MLGVDDFAFRRGRRYGTILVDLEKRRVIDLLAGGESATLAAWLKAHPSVKVVSRDRSPTYAAAITEGVPSAMQVADRFHLLTNMREVLEKTIKRCYRFLRTQTLAAPTATASAPEDAAYDGCRLRLAPHLQGARRGGGSKPTPRLNLPSARQASWMLLRPEGLENEEEQAIELLCQLSPEVARAQQLALSFVEVVKERRVDDLRGWLVNAHRGEVTEFVGFANGLAADLQAVRAALEYEWSQGQVEGQVNRLKLVKRLMYGRSKLDLLRARVLCAA